MADTHCNKIEITRFINNPVPSNAYLIVDNSIKECIVIDPGSKEQSDICEYIKGNELVLKFIILTHEHFDHCWGVNYLLNTFESVQIVTTSLCAEWVKTPMNYFNKLYFHSDEMFCLPRVDIIAEEVEWKILWNNVRIDLVTAKGHTNKGMCIKFGNVLFTGDTMIFNTKPVMKKRYGASIEDLHNTIKRIYNEFDENTLVYPGHGETFRLYEMKQFYIDYFDNLGLNATI